MGKKAEGERWEDKLLQALSEVFQSRLSLVWKSLETKNTVCRV